MSTSPVQQPLASRVLSLAAGRRVDAMDALEANPAAAWDCLPGHGGRIRADNPSARLGGLPEPRCWLTPGWRRLGCSPSGRAGPAPAPGTLGPGDRPIALRPGRRLVLAVPDETALADLTGLCGGPRVPGR